MKFKNNMFFNFRTFSLKTDNFFLLVLLNQLKFLVVVRIHKIHLLDRAFLLLATIAVIIEEVSFPCFHSSNR